MERKKLMQLIGSLFVFVIFIASYLSFSSAAPIAKTTTTTILQTFPAIGYANATVIGYGNTATVYIICDLNSTASKLSNALTTLENNGSINNFYSPTINTTLIYLNTMDPVRFKSYLENSLGENASHCISLSADTKLLLPKVVDFKINSQQYPIPIPNSTRSLSFSLPVGTNNTVKLRILALLTQNGSIYNLTASVVR